METWGILIAAMRARIRAKSLINVGDLLTITEVQIFRFQKNRSAVDNSMHAKYSDLDEYER